MLARSRAWSEPRFSYRQARSWLESHTSRPLSCLRGGRCTRHLRCNRCVRPLKVFATAYYRTSAGRSLLPFAPKSPNQGADASACRAVTRNLPALRHSRVIWPRSVAAASNASALFAVTAVTVVSAEVRPSAYDPPCPAASSGTC